ncbi:MAG: DUF3426 domain-containing protein [Gammaproteobacteria bacterium]|nr:MAG: DUF3426 domain-containing protein [Gammaproteobacteria bacterium]
MFTQCPECLTIYTLVPEELARGRGSVRCAHCGAVFDALRSLTESLPAGRIQRLDQHGMSEELPQLSMPVMRPSREDEADAVLPAATARMPGFTRSVAPARGRDSPWRVATALLLPLLLAQVAWAERHELLRNPLTRPWIARACATLGCSLPLQRDSEGLVLLSRDVRPHPSVPNALIISATMRNDADHAQAFPLVEITLTDLDEHRIAMRRFHPREYVGDARTIGTGLASGASTALVFEVADPGKNAVAYEFKFL